MNKNTIIWIVVVIVIAIAGFFAYKNWKVIPDETTSNNVTGIEEVRTFNVAGRNFAFNMPEIKVNKGDNVIINFKSEQGFHDFGIDEYNVRTKQYMAGGGETVSFKADKVGVFEYYCSVGNHRAMGMKGTLIVE